MENYDSQMQDYILELEEIIRRFRQNPGASEA